MPHVMKFFSSDYITAADLDGKPEWPMVIEAVSQGEVIGEKGRKSKKPFVRFKGARKPLALNKTNAKTIIGLYGPHTEQWVGKSVGLYATTTQDAKGQTVECVRVRPRVPTGPASEPPPDNSQQAEQPADEPEAHDA